MRLPIALFLLAASAVFGQMQVVALPSQSPLVNIRIVFLTGAAYDPTGKPGVANLTAALMAQGGTRELTYKQVVDALFPIAASISSVADKEMVTFYGATHVDNLERFYGLFRDMLLDPGWRNDDFRRVKDDAINYLRVGLRGNNDEELAKEVLYQTIYAGHPYGHQNAGTVASLQSITIGDLRRFYQARFTQTNLVIGIAGGYPATFVDRVKKDFEVLPKGAPSPRAMPAPKSVTGAHAVLIEKDTASVAISLGFPIEVKRGHPDYAALLLAQSYFGPHRASGGRLFDRMRELRGLNYGDYAYLEYFPRGMFLFQPDPNLARQQQIFQIWIRPVKPPAAHFSIRLAVFELDKLIREGLTEEIFANTRAFLLKNLSLLMNTKQAELGYAIDSLYYGIPGYTSYLNGELAKLTAKAVNEAIQRHLRLTDLRIVAVARDCEALKKDLLGNKVSHLAYDSPKPEDVLDEDKLVERWRIDLKPEWVRIIPSGSVFE